MMDELILEPGQKVHHYIYSVEEDKFEKRYAYILSVHDDTVWLDEYNPHTLQFFKSPKRIKLLKKSFEKVLFRKNLYLWSTKDEPEAARIIDVFLYENFEEHYEDAISYARTLVNFRNSHGIFKENNWIPREKKLPSNEE